jgi:site-specific DNA-cytosine methylase
VSTSYDLESIVFNGKTFNKGRCYNYHETILGSNIDAVVGILRFLPNQHEKCVLIVQFEDTLLGMEEENGSFKAVFRPSSYFQVHAEVPALSLRNFGEETREVTSIPTLVYEPQTTHSRQRFGHSFDKRSLKRCGRRNKLRVLELFAGCGGTHQGLKNSGFTTVKMVEHDKNAVETLTTNNSAIPVYAGDVNVLLQRYEKSSSRDELGGIHHDVHASPPCQGFSGANRRGGKNDSVNNELSMRFVDAVRIFEPTTATFENILGMWRRKHLHYVKKIAVELLKLGYKVRRSPLWACDYGDPQKRPRFFIFAAKGSAILPGIPPKTHGDGLNLQPYVTVKDALTGLKKNLQLPNMAGASTSARPGHHGVVRLEADGLAPADRAGSCQPFHYEEERYITVWEAAQLQSFPME